MNEVQSNPEQLDIIIALLVINIVLTLIAISKGRR